MFGIPSGLMNPRRPRAMLNWYRSRLLVRKQDRPVRSPLYPVVAQIEPTVQCDLDCTFCQSRELRRARPRMHMIFNEFERVINELGFLVRVGLVGMGEPTLHPDFFKMAELTDRLGIATETVTNCNRHSQEIADKLVSSALKRIAVSVDGATPESYERTRIGGNFRRTISNLERLVRLRGSAERPKFDVQMVALNDNYREIPDLVRLCANIGVDSLMIQGRPTDWGKDAYVGRTVGAAAAMACDDYEAVMERSKAVASELSFELEDHRSLYDDEHRCAKPWCDLFVSSTGDVVPCCTIADPGVVCMGNLLEQSFDDIWNGPKYLRFRRALQTDGIPRCCWQCYAPAKLLEDQRMEAPGEVL